MMMRYKLTTSKETSESNLNLATSDRGSSALFQEGINIAPDTTTPGMQDIVTVKGLGVEPAQVEHDAAPVNAAESNVGVVPARADGELAPGLPHDGKRGDDLLGGAQHDVRRCWEPAGLGPWEVLERGERRRAEGVRLRLTMVSLVQSRMPP